MSNVWQDLTPNISPIPRAAHSSAIVGNSMVVFGGWDGQTGLNDTHIFNFDSQSWEMVDPRDGFCPSRRNNHVMWSWSNCVYVHGGHDGNAWCNDLYRFNVDTREWSEIPLLGDFPSPRACHSCTRIGSKVFFMGGYNGKQCHNDHYIFDMETSRWSIPVFSDGSIIPPPRNAHAAAASRTHIFLIGGHDGEFHLGDFYSLHLRTMTWKKLNTENGPGKLRGLTCVMVDNSLFVFGGCRGLDFADGIYEFNLATEEWHRHKIAGEVGPSSCQRLSAVAYDSDKIIYFGGFDGKVWRKEIFKLDVTQLNRHEIKDRSSATFASSFLSMLNNPDALCDITINLQDGQNILAHKAILVSRSSFYRAMFMNGFSENQSRTLDASDWSYEPYYAMMEYIYAGKIDPDLEPEYLQELVVLADRQMLPHLRDYTASRLAMCLDKENVCESLVLAEEHSCPMLKRKAIEFILDHWEFFAEVGLVPLHDNPHLLIEVTSQSLNRDKPTMFGLSQQIKAVKC
eukprot:TRINITY_DN774094_c0_g1_i1.p1 TRINITY_DN774094_c0_g1~~TRINITY_DN774094_c0_g1_i1.p1  ORF type:complete len:545 (-),score=105.11 TRINITY_DN774094_c0_g1_i1:86-1621(-)